ncbi:MAG: GDP-mannose 4,6-dehydratase [Candidatus Gastranaerophilales bacterium]|nr:GDP-mannose 4,6-dehydratase [Candidatus Gastranaerophilales bacterium]
MSKIFLVTGGAGFIGSHVIDGLLKQNYKVICVDNFDNFYPQSIKQANIKEHLKSPNYSIFNVDIRNFEQLKLIFETSKITDIIHLAALAGVRPSLLQPVKYAETNINGTLNLLELSKKFGVKKFIFGSSSSVYGSRETGPFNEEMKIDKPISPYASTKASCEQICYTYSHLYNLPIICLRFFTVYGPRQRPDLAIHKFAKLMREGKPIPLFGDGTSLRDYTYIDDILNGIFGAINYDKTPFEIVNLGESRTVKLNYLIELLEKNLGISAKIEQYINQPGDVPITYADISKAKELFNYNPKTPIEQGIEKFVKWFDIQYNFLITN